MKKYIRKDKIYLTENLRRFHLEHGDEEKISRKIKSVYKKKLSDLNFMEAMELDTVEKFNSYN